MLEFRLPELVPAPATAVVLYDRGDGDARAHRAAATLARLGYTDLTCLDGGLAAWTAAGNDVDTGWNVPCKDFGERVLVTGDVPYLTADELAARLAEGQNIGAYDVRTGREYRDGSLPVSISAPSFEWALHAKDMAAAHDAIVIHCAGRTRSIIGAATARVLGMANFWALENGTMGWRLSDRDLAKGQARELGEPSPESRKDATERARKLATDQGAQFMAPADLKALLDRRGDAPAYLFDTRTTRDFEAGHIPHAILLPGGQACQRADDFAAVPGAPVVFVDDGDARAALSAYWFRRMGFPRVSVLEGGVAAWRAAGHQVETGRDRPMPLGLSEAERRSVPWDAAMMRRALAVSDPPAVIDVGPSKRVAAAHLKGARWAPRGFLEDRIGAVADPSAPVVVTAWQPEQATFAAATLADMGYRSVARLTVPGRAWADSFEVEGGLPADAEPTLDTLAIPYRESRESMLAYLEWEEKLGERHRDPSGS